MFRSEDFSPPAHVFDDYLPATLTDDDLRYRCSDALLNSPDFDMTEFSSGHRQNPDLFDPLSDDRKAAEAFQDDSEFSMDSTYHDDNDIGTYLLESSSVIPHIPNLSVSTSTTEMYHTPQYHSSPPNSPNYFNRKCTKGFLIHDHATGKDRRPYLHEFLRLLLEDEEYEHVIQFVDRKQGIFKLNKPNEIAELWKQAKGRNTDNEMTYDKVARALRYYYGSGIMQPNAGRFTFRFGPKSGFGVTWWPVY
ncbi:hypothetical protein I4U23_013878 [Adineta vaga]|nr:hypothetical protein I4U23_013878 [Adineta vaga]